MKLDSEYQTAMAEADDNKPDSDEEFEALPDGYYRAAVESIKLSPKAGPSGYKMWIVVWRILAPKKWAKRTQWDRISLSPKAAFKMRELYDALGYEYDSDSDELVGEQAILELSKSEIESGPKKGQMGNDVERVLSVDDEEFAALVGK